jgi:4-amino-4-deoxy-L-arabinose transferase-like glycosyltransferase
MARFVELGVLLLGISLRLFLPLTYDVKEGFDYWFHYPYVEWFIKHNELPPITLVREVFHPPLFYFLGGLGMRLGASHQQLLWLSALSGVIRLLVIWLGLRLFFRDRPLVRVIALTVAALLPATLQNDGILNAESLHSMLTTTALLFMLLGLRAGGRGKWTHALAAGLLVALALLTKVTAVVMALSLGLAALSDTIVPRGSWRDRLVRGAPWVASLALMLALSGWYYQRNQRLWKQRFPTSFNTTEIWKARPIQHIPPWDRRPADFYYGWQTSYFTHPYESEDKQVKVRFWPTLVASTFVDYYNYRFFPPPEKGEPSVKANWRQLPATGYRSSQLSYAGGIVLAATVAAAWCAILVLALRRREKLWLLALAVPALSVFALLRFAVHHPFDDYGVIKGNYCQFAAAPLFALTGVAFEWLWRRRRVAAMVVLLALAAMAQYTLLARGTALYNFLRS